MSISHAHFYSLSPSVDIRAEWTQEILAHVKTPEYAWYALKHELGKNGKLHLHLIAIREICDSNKNGGAMRPDNYPGYLLRRCPKLNAWCQDNGSKFTHHCCKLTSTACLEYMQKEGDLAYYNLPRDTVEMQPYFADLLANRAHNPDFDKWQGMYMDQHLPMPANPSLVWDFLMREMHLKSSMRIVSDTRKLKERSVALSHYINGQAGDDTTLESNPFEKKRKLDTKPVRVCPRCPFLTPLEPRKQMCDKCRDGMGVHAEGYFQMKGLTQAQIPDSDKQAVADHYNNSYLDDLEQRPLSPWP